MIVYVRRLLTSFVILGALISGAAAQSTGTQDHTEGYAVPLTNEERAWITTHRTIRVAFDGYFPPYSFLNDQGEMEGLAVDVMRILTARAGLTIEISPQTVWKDLIEAAKQRDVDVVATMGRQPEREAWFVFTRPYIFKSLVIMTRTDEQGITSPADLEGRTVAVVKSYQYVKPLLERHPTITPYYVDTMLDGLNAVSVGNADAAITFLGAGHYLKAKYQMANLKFAAVFERDRFTESIAVRKDWPELASILDKALSSISEREMAELSRRWVGPAYKPGIPMRTAIGYAAAILAAVLLAGAAFIIWNRTLQAEVRKKTEEVRRELEERKSAEALLQASENKYRRLHDSMMDGYAFVDMSGTIRDFNDSFRGLLGYGWEEMERLTYRDITPLKWHAAEAKIISEQVLTRGYSDVYEKEYLRKDGAILPVELRTFLVRDDHGANLGMWAIVRDISDRKRAELELQSHREHLEELVKERTLDLERSQKALQYLLEDVNEANERLRELDRLKSLFIASMSHELRTPLNSIIGFTGILLQGLAGPLNEEQKKQLGMVKGSSEHLLSLITDIIDLSKIEAGKIDISVQPFDLVETARTVLATFGPTADRKGLSLELDAPPALRIASDPRRVLQILVNLVGNAVKFTEQGKVTVSVSAESDRVDVSVRDSGIGIRNEDMGKLFRSFGQITAADMPQHEGTGLGLYLSKRLVSLLSGEIRAESELGRGSVFTFTLPMVTDERR